MPWRSEHIRRGVARRHNRGEAVVSSTDRHASPNLLVIMADQWRYDWLGAAGTPGVSTPNIDALAASGVRFTHACTNSAICVPARIALASGRSPERLEALDNSASLPADVPTYYQRLRDADFRVGVVGKLDLAKSLVHNGPRGDRPAVFRWGFTHPLEAEGKWHAGRLPDRQPRGPYGVYLEERGLLEAFADDYAERLSPLEDARREGLPPTSRLPYSPDGLYRDSVLPEDAFEDRWLGDRAVEWIEQVSSDYPWHLFVSFVGPHDPFDPPAEWADRFRESEMPNPVPAGSPGKPSRVSTFNWSSYSDAQVLRARQQYTASLALIDHQVGRLLAALESRGFSDDTVIVVTSDHGEMLGDHGLFLKSVPYEASMRVPLILAGPGIAPAVRDELVEMADVHPTLCELAGIGIGDHLDARSLVPLLRGDGAARHREVVVCSERHYLALRSARHKYVCNMAGHPLSDPDDPEELYDLDVDPTEQHNLFLEDPERARQLRDELILTARADGQDVHRLHAVEDLPAIEHGALPN